MPITDPLDLLKVNADDIKRAITALEEQIRALDRERGRLLSALQVFRQLERVNSPEPDFEGAEQWLMDATIADWVAKLLSKRGEQAHARVILKWLREGLWAHTGRAVPSMPTLVSALNRDPRFERVEGRKNFWALVAPLEDGPPEDPEQVGPETVVETSPDFGDGEDDIPF